MSLPWCFGGLTAERGHHCDGHQCPGHSGPGDLFRASSIFHRWIVSFQYADRNIKMELVWLLNYMQHHAQSMFFHIFSSWLAVIVLVVLRLSCPASFHPWTKLWRNELKCSIVAQSWLRIKSLLCIATSQRFSSLIRLQFPILKQWSCFEFAVGYSQLWFHWHQLTLWTLIVISFLFSCCQTVAQPGAFGSGRCCQLRSFIWCWISWISPVWIRSKSKRTGILTSNGTNVGRTW